jgi:hypothetical protein
VNEPKPKLFEISKRAVWEAFRRVKANKGGIGVDEQSIAEFEQELQGNLYKLWNRLSSGSLFPAAGYVERWLKAPLQRGDDSLVERDRGTAQGSAMTAPMQSRASNSSGRSASVEEESAVRRGTQESGSLTTRRESVSSPCSPMIAVCQRRWCRRRASLSGLPLSDPPGAAPMSTRSQQRSSSDAHTISGPGPVRTRSDHT